MQHLYNRVTNFTKYVYSCSVSVDLAVFVHTNVEVLDIMETDITKI